MSQATQADPPAPQPAAQAGGDERLAADVLRAEYSVLMSGLTAGWGASMTRTSVFLGVLSAVAVAIGLAAQASGGFGRETLVFALTLLPVALFLGAATFLRQVQIQRELAVYIIGMNRIRRFLSDLAPLSKEFLVLSTYDDEASLYRNLGTGMLRRPPRFRLGHVLVQVPGIVGVITAQVAAAIVGIAAVLLGLGSGASWVGAALGFVLVLALLLGYWSRSIGELTRGIKPRFPTPPGAMEAPY